MLSKPVLETALEEEMADHLGYNLWGDRRSMDYRHPPGAVRRLDDPLLRVFCERYLGTPTKRPPRRTARTPTRASKGRVITPRIRNEFSTAAFTSVAGHSSVRTRSYQVPGFPPRSAGSAGPTGRNPALVSTFCDAGFWTDAAARTLRRP